jgi:hypothetical protein
MLEAQRKAVLKAFKKINALRRELTHSAKMEYLVREYKLKKYVKTRNKTLEEYDPSRVLFESNATLGLRPWTFHDENWIRVRNRWKDRPVVAAGLPLNVIDNLQEPTEEVKLLNDGSILFDGKTQTNDEWLILYLDPQEYQWNNFSWSFPIRRDTYFREFQFAFRYQDFYNRYRFRFENDYIYFDKHIKGVFYSGFSSVPFHMDLGIPYNVRIDAYRNNFRCYINGTLMMNEFDFDNTLPIGSIAIILWEKDGVTDMKATVGPMCVRQLLKKSNLPT